jgi:uncharacterized membrane protein
MTAPKPASATRKKASRDKTPPDKTQAKIWHRKVPAIVRLHIRLVVSALIGVALFGVLMQLGQPARITTRALIAWNVGAICYLATVLWLVLRCNLDRLRERAAEDDEGAPLILVITVVAAVVSLISIFAELGAARADKGGWLSPALALSTVIVSWLLIQSIYAIHYAHEFYGEAEGGLKGGLKFPADGPDADEQHPEYWDFIYFSFVIGMTFQVSDVQVTGKSVRRLVVGHGFVSFLYNVAVLALMVNMGSDFIKG